MKNDQFDEKSIYLRNKIWGHLKETQDNINLSLKKN